MTTNLEGVLARLSPAALKVCETLVPQDGPILLPQPDVVLEPGAPPVPTPPRTVTLKVTVRAVTGSPSDADLDALVGSMNVVVDEVGDLAHGVPFAPLSRPALESGELWCEKPGLVERVLHRCGCNFPAKSAGKTLLVAAIFIDGSAPTGWIDLGV